MRFHDASPRPGSARSRSSSAARPRPGDLRPDGDVADVARGYERRGARAMSVLVDERFAGSWTTCARRARRPPAAPREGFFSTPEHLREAREAGADAALLILRDLDDATARR